MVEVEALYHKNEVIADVGGDLIQKRDWGGGRGVSTV